MAGSKLHKDADASIPEQICRILRERIEAGVYVCGHRMATVRALAAEFGVSPVTVLRALDMLKAEGVLEHFPNRGMFVSRQVSSAQRRLACCLAFPEKSFPHSLPLRESEAILTEIYLGVCHAASESRVNMQFRYFEENPNEVTLRLQAAMLEQFDMVIFLGKQLSALQRLSAETRPTICFIGGQQPTWYKDTPNIYAIDYDREDADNQLLALLRGTGCHFAGVITSDSRQHHVRVTTFVNNARQIGVSCKKEDVLLLPEKCRIVGKPLRDFLRRHRGAFLFCDQTDCTPLVYEAAMQEHLLVGTDFQMTGIASGVTFAGLLPHYTFLRIPHFDMACQTILLAAKNIREAREWILPKWTTVLNAGSTVHTLKEND